MEAIREKPSRRAALSEVASYFFKMGIFGFGGPLALMAAIQKDLVESRAWIAPADFGRALALIKALPGPSGTQTAIFMGQVRAGKLGGLAAGICLIFPAFLMMLLLGIFYESIEALAWSKPLLFGMQATALGVITESVWRLSLPYRKSLTYWIVAAIAVGLTAWHASIEPLVIIGSGLLGILWTRLNDQQDSGLHMIAPGAAIGVGARKVAGYQAIGAWLLGGSATAAALPQLILVMLKSGALVFGTGLAIVPLLIHDVVDTHHWLTHQQFMEALAFGQITPGPVVITATFIGYKVAGLIGAVAATAAIFGPAFFNILTWFPWAERKLSASPYTRQFAMFAIAAVSGSILVTVARLASAPLEGGTHFVMAILATIGLIVSLFTHLPVWIVIPSGGIAWLLASAMMSFFPGAL